MTKIRIFKRLNLRRKPIATFSANCWETISGTQNYIQILKDYWLQIVNIWHLLKNKRLKFIFFDRATFSGFITKEFVCRKRRLKYMETVTSFFFPRKMV